jgi:uncharacterized protein (TIGR02594 family)
MSDLIWMETARQYIGTVEGPGKLDNPLIVAMYAKVGFPNIKHDEVPWCAAFVGAVLFECNMPFQKSLMARSYEDYGKRLSEPCYGAIGVKKRPGSARAGHVGFVVGANANEIIMISGNAKNSVNIAAFDRSTFTAFRWPPGLSIPSTLPKLAASVPGALRNVTEA